MEKLIKEILKESDFDWVEEIGLPVEIGDPIKQPRNTYRIHFTHEVSQEGAYWVDNWIDVPQENTESVLRFLSLLKLTDEDGSVPYEHDLAKKFLEGESWVLSDYDKEHLESEIKKGNIDLTSEEGREEAIDWISDWIRDDLNDNGLLVWDHWYDENARIAQWRVTYFDENGIEHYTKINV